MARVATLVGIAVALLVGSATLWWWLASDAPPADAPRAGAPPADAAAPAEPAPGDPAPVAAPAPAEGFRLAVLVRRAESGEPVAGALVHLAGDGLAPTSPAAPDAGAPPRHVRAATDPSGVAIFDFPGAASITALLVERTSDTGWEHYLPDPPFLVGPAPPRLRQLDLEVGPGGRLSGSVRRADGTPVAGARVRHSSRLPHELQVEAFPGVELRDHALLATTDAEGRYSVGGIGPAFELEVLAPDGLVAPRAWSGRVESGVHLAGLDVRVLPAVELRGELLRADGSPAAGLRVAVGVPPIHHAKLGLPELRFDRAGPAWAEPRRAFAHAEVGPDGRFSLPVPDVELDVFVHDGADPLPLAAPGDPVLELRHDPTSGPLVLQLAEGT